MTRPLAILAALALLAVGARLMRRRRPVETDDAVLVPMAAWDGTARCCAMGVDDPEHMVCTGYREHGWDILCHPYGVPDPMQRTYTTSTNSATYLYNARTGVVVSAN